MIVMTSSPLENTHCRTTSTWHAIMPTYYTHVQTTSGVARHHLPFEAYMVGLHEVWQAIITIRKNTWSNDIRRGMPSSPLDKIHNRTTSVVACHHLHWIAHKVERHQAWHVIIYLGKNTRYDGVGCGMPSSPMDCTNGQTMSGVAGP